MAWADHRRWRKSIDSGRAWLSAALIALASESFGAAADDSPASRPAAPTLRDYRQSAYGFSRRLGTEAIRARRACSPDPLLDETAALIDDWLLMRNRLSRAFTRYDVISRAEDLMRRGGDDPLLHMAYAACRRADDNAWDANEHFRAAIDRMEECGYPVIWKARAASSLALLLDAHGQKDQRDFEKLAADTYIRAIQQGAFGRADMRILVEEVGEAASQWKDAALAIKFCDRLDQIPCVDEWAKRIVRGKLSASLAWAARGNGFAGGVTPEGWRGFEENMSRAGSLFRAAHELHPELPEAAGELVDVAVSSRDAAGGDAQTWFDRAVAAQFDWPDAYSSMLKGLRPRWGGSHAELVEFGRKCMATGRYDTDVPYQLVAAIHHICTDLADASYDDGNADPDVLQSRLWNVPHLYEDAIDVLEKTAAGNPDVRSPDLCFSLAAAFAWRSGHWADAARFLDRVAWKPDRDAAETVDASPQRIVADVALLGGQWREMVLPIDAKAGQGAWEEAASMYESIAPSLAADARAAAALRGRLWTARLMRDFAKGGWTPLTFEEGLPGWRVWRGAWQPSGGRAVKAGPMREGLLMICDAPLGNRLAIRGTLHAKNLTRDFANASVMFSGTRGARYFNCEAGTILSGKNKAAVGWPFGDPARKEIELPKNQDRDYDFDLQVWDRSASLTVNGVKVFSGPVKRSEGRTPGPLIALGGAYGTTAGWALYENIDVRRLTEKPEGIETPLPDPPPSEAAPSNRSPRVDRSAATRPSTRPATRPATKPRAQPTTRPR